LGKDYRPIRIRFLSREENRAFAETSTPALKPTLLSVQWVRGCFPMGQVARTWSWSLGLHLSVQAKYNCNSTSVSVCVSECYLPAVSVTYRQRVSLTGSECHLPAVSVTYRQWVSLTGRRAAFRAAALFDPPWSLWVVHSGQAEGYCKFCALLLNCFWLKAKSSLCLTFWHWSFTFNP